MLPMRGETMIVAIDKTSGKVLGQLLERPASDMLLLLTRSGYFTVLAGSVRLEEVA